MCNKRTCQAPGVINFPLALAVSSWSDYEDDSTMPCSRPLMAKLAEKLEWTALRNTVGSVSILTFHIWHFFIFSSTGVSTCPRHLRKLCWMTSNCWQICISCCWKDKFWKVQWPVLTVSAFTKSRQAFQICSLMRMKFDLNGVLYTNFVKTN